MWAWLLSLPLVRAMYPMGPQHMLRGTGLDQGRKLPGSQGPVFITALLAEAASQCNRAMEQKVNGSALPARKKSGRSVFSQATAWGSLVPPRNQSTHMFVSCSGKATRKGMTWSAKPLFSQI